MQASRRSATAPAVSLVDALTAAGLEQRLASLLEAIPHTAVKVDPRRPFRHPGAARPEVLFVRSGMLAKFKSDGGGRRQIVALRFAGEAILPSQGPADFGIQAIVRSDVLIGSAKEFNRIVDAHAELGRFMRRRLLRSQAISYEWLVNCGRRDSTARVAHLLCETAARTGIREPGRMINPFTQQQIADITGQTSVNVNRVLADLQRQGLIERCGREIVFRDWAEIRRVASFQPSYLELAD